MTTAAGFAVHREAHAADEVLTEVEHRRSRWAREDLPDPDLLDPPHGRAWRRDQSADVWFEPCRRLPRVVVEPGTVPSVEREPGVVRLSLVEVGHEEWAGRGSPVLVGDDHIGRAVVEGDLELGEQAESVAVDVAEHVPFEKAPPPAVGNDGAQHVLATGQQRCDVVGVVPQAVLVARPSRCEQVVTDHTSVEVDLVDASRRHVQAGPFDPATGHVEGSPEQRRRAGCVEGIHTGGRDPRRAPVGGLDEADLDGQRLTPRGLTAVEAPDPDAYVSAAA